ncbi:MAG: FHA domain-containing protein [Gaiellales bacterium]
MLCRSCHRQLTRGAAACDRCGAAVPGAALPLELVLPDARRIALEGHLDAGRAHSCAIVLDDPSVSRRHAMFVAEGPTATVEDLGSSHGTWLHGRRIVGAEPLRAGQRIRLGDSELLVERRRGAHEAGGTRLVPIGATAVVPVVAASSHGLRPRLRSGYALKRLAASEGAERYVLEDLRGGSFSRLDEAEASLLDLLDGRHGLPELVAEAERLQGPAGPGLLARLLADLGARGMLADVDAATGATLERRGWRRLFTPRRIVFRWAPALIERIYERAGFLLFARLAFALEAALGVAGLAAFVYLVAGRYGTPFVVAHHVGLGGAVFVAGRFAAVSLHELAHGLTMSSFGRRVRSAGLKVVGIFPYAYVDTSEAWFEPRRRRIAISLSGPASDALVAGAASLIALPLGPGAVRDVLFQVAFGAYVAGFMNLNPFLDRDGYHALVDLLREPQLRRRSRARLSGVISGRGGAPERRLVTAFAFSSLVWLLVAGGMTVAFASLYTDRLVALSGSRALVWSLVAALAAIGFLPAALTVARPLTDRLGDRE